MSSQIFYKISVLWCCVGMCVKNTHNYAPHPPYLGFGLQNDAKNVVFGCCVSDREKLR